MSNLSSTTECDRSHINHFGHTQSWKARAFVRQTGWLLARLFMKRFNLIFNTLLTSICLHLGSFARTHARTDTHTNKHMHTHTHTNKHAHIHKYTQAQIPIHTYIHTYTLKNIHTRKYTHIHKFMHTHTNTHMHTDTHKHRHINTMHAHAHTSFKSLNEMILV